MSNNVLPAGIILPTASTLIPEGFLGCDGSTVSRTQYPALFAAIGTIHGSGDGSTTFHLPDYRGRALRGWDNTAGRDPDAASRTAANAGGAVGDNIGSVQNDQYKSHDHNIRYNVSTSGGENRPLKDTNGSGISDTPTDNSGGNETRMKNANVNFIIKF